MPHPFLFEINTRHWLAALSERHGREIDLSRVPEEELVRLQQRGVSHVWLMGVWPTGPKSRAEAVRHPDLRAAYGDALPGWSEEDVLGSPYAVGAYAVSPLLGGDVGLEALRQRLLARGIKLILDFVPNHTGLDHPWAQQRPHIYVHKAEAFADSIAIGGRHIAHGKDPYFPGWTDTLQLDYRRKETREVVTEAIRSVASRCDGVRCDMAMLLLSDVFDHTWGHVPLDGPRAAGEFWEGAIATVKRDRKDFLFLAEAYWELEGRLCDLGFDYAYDKKLYDLFVHDHAWQVNPHVYGMGSHNFQRAHFLENHDEPRAAATLAPALHRAAALLMMGLPGMRFLHEGQSEGARTFARVQLGRRKSEPVDGDVQALYDTLLPAVAASAVGCGEPTLLSPRRAWDDNPTAQCFTLVQWQEPGRDDRFDLVVVNMADHRAQCYAPLTARGLGGGTWQLADRLSEERWQRDGDNLVSHGLYLDVGPRAAQLFSFTRS